MTAKQHTFNAAQLMRMVMDDQLCVMLSELVNHYYSITTSIREHPTHSTHSIRSKKEFNLNCKSQLQLHE